ncbi:MAG TPA: hypothetical protein VHD84_01245 [Candidatus Saccharimonadales bacterium]|nr:hypothetical protein [Candidatus Saccharimonadales bacterium]
MNIKTHTQKGLVISSAALLFTIVGAGLPLLFVKTGWGIPNAANAFLELAGFLGLSYIFVKFILQK